MLSKNRKTWNQDMPPLSIATESGETLQIESPRKFSSFIDFSDAKENKPKRKADHYINLRAADVDVVIDLGNKCKAGRPHYAQLRMRNCLPDRVKVIVDKRPPTNSLHMEFDGTTKQIGFTVQTEIEVGAVGVLRLVFRPSQTKVEKSFNFQFEMLVNSKYRISVDICGTLLPSETPLKPSALQQRAMSSLFRRPSLSHSSSATKRPQTNLAATRTPNKLYRPNENVSPVVLHTCFVSPSLIRSPALCQTATPLRSKRHARRNQFFDDASAYLEAASNRAFLRWLHCLLRSPADAEDLGESNSACLFTLSNCDFTAAARRIERDVDRKQLTVAHHINLQRDSGSRTHLVELLMRNYDPRWITVALASLDSLSSTNVPIKRITSAALNRKLRQHLFGPPMTGRVKKATLNEKDEFNARVLKRSLCLFWLLDCLKSAKFLPNDPCLFKRDAEHKSTEDVLLSFGRLFLQSWSTLTTRMANLGAKAVIRQTELHEHTFQVENLAIDLRDGTVLLRVAEILLEGEAMLPSNRLHATKPKDQSSGVIERGSLVGLARYPAIDRLQRVYNCEQALSILRMHNRGGRDLMTARDRPIQAKEIADGYQEATMSLIWQLLLHFQLERALSLDDLRELIPPENSLELPDNLESLLIIWARRVCAVVCPELMVESLDECFVDCRVFCAICSHHFPAILRWRDVRQTTTSKPDDQLDVPPSIRRLNNQHNFRLFSTVLKKLSPHPLLLDEESFAEGTILPPGLVLAQLAFLALTIVNSKRDGAYERSCLNNLAASVIQKRWRSRLNA